MKRIKSLPRRVHIIAGALVLATVISATALALRPADQSRSSDTPHDEHAHHDHDHDHEVASAVTTTPEAQPQTDSQTTPAAQTAQTKPASKPSTGTQPSAQPTPTTPSNPAPAPGFEVTIAAEAAIPNGPTQVSVPFGVTRGAGHTAAFTFNAAITSAPAGNHGVSCSVAMDAPTKGYLLVSAPDTAPTGMYICRLTVHDGTQTRTAQFDFIVTDDSVEP